MMSRREISLTAKQKVTNSFALWLSSYPLQKNHHETTLLSIYIYKNIIIIYIIINIII